MSRRLWQIHLSTVVALAIAAGVLVWPVLIESEICRRVVENKRPDLLPRFHRELFWYSVCAAVLLLAVGILAERSARRRTGSSYSFWRVHLSTALALMLACGAMVGLNAATQFDLIRLDSESAEPISIEDAMEANRDLGYAASYLHIRRYGWPIVFWDRWNRCHADKWQ